MEFAFYNKKHKTINGISHGVFFHPHQLTAFPRWTPKSDRYIFRYEQIE